MSGLRGQSREACARLAAWAGAVLIALALSACATPQRQPVAPGTQVWSGRLALTIEGPQAQSFSGGFELKGGATAGELTLYNPLGGTAAVLALSLIHISEPTRPY